MMNLDERLERLALFQQGLDSAPIAEEDVFNFRIARSRQIRSGDDHFRRVVAPHGVEGDGNGGG
jgi:hypothetical protein